MATRSTIAVEHRDGTVEQIYCHWDGYLSHNGEILNRHYRDYAKVCDLIALGDISSLGTQIGEQHAFDGSGDPEWTTAYGRDRGETDVGGRRFKDFADYSENMQAEEYDYCWRDAQWWVSDHGGGWVLLEEAIADQLISEELENN